MKRSRTGVAIGALLLGGVLLVCALRAQHAEPARPLRLWHAYRGTEEQALLDSAKLFTQATGVAVEPLAVPYDAFAAKVTNAIPHGNGPDVFIFNHERLRQFHQEELLAPTDRLIDRAAYVPQSIDALTVDGHLYGYRCPSSAWRST